MRHTADPNYSYTNGSSSGSLMYSNNEVKVDDGKLFYHRRWWRRGQAVQVESKNGDNFPAMIATIGEFQDYTVDLL